MDTKLRKYKQIITQVSCVYLFTKKAWMFMHVIAPFSAHLLMMQWYVSMAIHAEKECLQLTLEQLATRDSCDVAS